MNFTRAKNAMKPVLIIGGGGHAKVLIESLRKSNSKIIGLTDTAMAVGSFCCNVTVLGDDNLIYKYKPADIDLVNGLGSIPGEDNRWELERKFRNQDYSFASIIHPSAVLASDFQIKSGVQIMAGVIIQPNVIIGKSCIINTGVKVDHDCVIEEHCHLAPGVTLSGNVTIGKRTHIGTGTSVIQGVNVGQNCIIAAGSVIYKDVPSNTKVLQQRFTQLQDIF